MANVSKEFVQNFNIVATWLGCEDVERESFKVLCRGNIDAAQSFMKLVADRIRNDPRHGINDRILQNIEAGRDKR